MHYYTYVIVHPQWGFFYVGVRQSKLSPEQDATYWGCSKHLDKLRRVIPRGWRKHIISTYPSRAEALDAEYALTDPRGLNGIIVNRSRGGFGWRVMTAEMQEILRRPKSAATRERMSKPKSARHCENIAVARRGKGKPLNERQKAALLAAHLGVPRKPETKIKIGEGNRRAYAEGRRDGSAAAQKAWATRRAKCPTS